MRSCPHHTAPTGCDSRYSTDRRSFLGVLLGGVLGGIPAVAARPEKDAKLLQRGSPRSLGIPGPFPGRVVEVLHQGSIQGRSLVREAIRDMVARGMQELVGASDAVEAWRFFFQPGDVVGVKVNPVGWPHAISSHELVHEVTAGLQSAGVKPRDVVVFDRYRAQFRKAGYVKNLPEGVRWDASVEDYDDLQLDIVGYDPDVYREIELVSPRHPDPADPRTRRSHLSLIVSRKVEKIINLPVLKDHASAGVTLALKNMSHGFVNNVARSHGNPSTNACNTFIPAICSLPQIRSKVVLHILDGLRGMFDGGPGGRLGSTWDNHTLYFATDPVSLDRIGWEVVDSKRVALGLPVVAESRWIPPADEAERRRHSFRQPEHIELSGALGLGVFEREKIELRRAKLS